MPTEEESDDDVISRSAQQVPFLLRGNKPNTAPMTETGRETSLYDWQVCLLPANVEQRDCGTCRASFRLEFHKDFKIL